MTTTHRLEYPILHTLESTEESLQETILHTSLQHTSNADDTLIPDHPVELGLLPFEALPHLVKLV